MANQIIGPAIICDIDGTAAIGIGNGEGQRKAYDYHKCGNDMPNYVVFSIIAMYLNTMRDEGGKVIFLSGRENVEFPGKSERKDICYRQAIFNDKEYPDCKTLTHVWIRFYGDGWGIKDTDFELHMRNADDYRPDDEIKEEFYHNIIDGRFIVDFVLDDRNQVVRKWRELGLTCLQVADGNF